LTARSIAVKQHLQAYHPGNRRFFMVWEERWHPLREEWVVIAAHRQDRPWSGEEIRKRRKRLPKYSKSCYLCPGNSRVGGKQNPQYTGIFVFDNDHPCVGGDAPLDLDPPGGIYQVRPARGIARVLCYSPAISRTC
jgi:UDPglucose--hexose-1-phosphate uridylyltransferase